MPRLSLRKRAVLFGISVATTLTLASFSADARDCKLEQEFSRLVETQLAAEPLLRKLHRAHLLNSVGDGLKVDHCDAVLKLPTPKHPNRKLSFGFGQFDLANEGDQRELLKLMTEANEADQLVRDILAGKRPIDAPAIQTLRTGLDGGAFQRALLRDNASRFLKLYEDRLLEQLEKAEPIWKSMLRRNRNILNAEAFVRIFAVDAIAFLKDLDNFQALLEGHTKLACNLLCRAHITPGFRIGDEPGPIDLVRYVRTSTCFGVLNSRNPNLEFLRRLENILAASEVPPEILLPKPTEFSPSRHFVVYDLANTRDKDGAVVTADRYPNLHALRMTATFSKPIQRPEGLMEPTIENAAVETCRGARGMR